MPEKNNTRFTGKCNIEFFQNECWRAIPNSRNWISSNGRVMVFTNDGYFNSVTLNTHPKTGNLQVRITDLDDGNKVTYKLVSTLVLSAFVGGYYYQRKLRHIDGNKQNCKLSNLEWVVGFQNGVDLDYLRKLNDDRLERGDLVVKKVLLNNMDWILYEYILENKGYFYKIFNEDYCCCGKFSEFLELINDIAIKKIQQGYYIPLQKNSKKYIEKDRIRRNKKFDMFLIFFLRRCIDDVVKAKNPAHAPDFAVDNCTTSNIVDFELSNLYNGGSPDDDAIELFANMSEDPIWG